MTQVQVLKLERELESERAKLGSLRRLTYEEKQMERSNSVSTATKPPSRVSSAGQKTASPDDADC